MKITVNESVCGSSYHGSNFNATVNEITKIIGEPTYTENDPDEKFQYEWDAEVEDEENGRSFNISIYNWKDYKRVKKSETINWHIGGDNRDETDSVLAEIEKRLVSIR